MRSKSNATVHVPERNLMQAETMHGRQVNVVTIASLLSADVAHSRLCVVGSIAAPAAFDATGEGWAAAVFPLLLDKAKNSHFRQRKSSARIDAAYQWGRTNIELKAKFGANRKQQMQ